MNGNGHPSPASHISRSDYVKLVAQHYIRAITDVTRVKREAEAEARSASPGESRWFRQPWKALLSSFRIGIPQGRIQLSFERQQQIRVSCAAFSTLLEYAPQYNVSEAEIREIIRYLDGRMTLVAGIEVGELAREEGSGLRSPLQEVSVAVGGGPSNGMLSSSWSRRPF
jgi:hypothetical protein